MESNDEDLELNFHEAAAAENDDNALLALLNDIDDRTGYAPLDRLIARKNIETMLHTRASILHRDDSYPDELTALLNPLNQQDTNGNTPLHIAVTSGSLDSVLLLVGVGANINIQNNQNQRPIDLAAGFPFSQALLEFIFIIGDGNDREDPCIALFKERISNLTPETMEDEEDGNVILIDFVVESKLICPLHIAVLSSFHVNIIAWLIHKNGVDIDEQDAEGKTVLHIAVEKGLENVVCLLIDNHANSNIEDDEGNTPLLTAFGCESTKMVELLVKSGANLSHQSRDEDRWSILQAVAANGDEWLDMLKILLKAPGINLSIGRKENKSPLELALQNNKNGSHSKTIQWLKAYPLTPSLSSNDSLEQQEESDNDSSNSEEENDVKLPPIQGQFKR